MNSYQYHRWYIVSTSLLVALFSATILHGDVIVTTGQDNPDGPIIGETTLRDAINEINSGSGGEVIAFTNNVSTIQLLAPLPEITEQVTIDGLASVAGTAIQPGDCDLVPSPVDNPELFETTLRILIDGNMIPNSNTEPRIGLFFSILAADSVVRGIRIQNIFGTSQSPFACGICASSLNQNITAECCMVSGIRGRRVGNQTGAAGLETITTVFKCYVQNIQTTPVNLAVTSTILQTGSAIGISNMRNTSDCRVECVSSGDLLGPSDTPLQHPDLEIGIAAGIANIPGAVKSSVHNTSKGCFFGTGSDDAQVIVKQCHVSHIIGGSTHLAIPATVSMNFVGGIYLENKFNTLVQDCFVCDIQTGSATLSDKGMVGSETTQLTTEGIYGIFISLDEHAGCIDNHVVQHVIHGSTTLNAPGSFATLAPPIGIFGQATPLVIENNTVSSVFGGCHITEGANSCIFVHPVGPLGTVFTKIGSVGIFSTQNSKLGSQDTITRSSTCPTPDNNFDPLFVVCNNHVDTILGGTRTAAGKNAHVENFGSMGIANIATEKAVTNNNMVHSISGTHFVTKAEGSSSLLTFGTKGIISQASLVELCNNIVSEISEDHVTTAANTLHVNTETFNLDAVLPGETITIADSPAQTTGISAYNVPDSITTVLRSIQDNQVHTIKGSSLTGSGIAVASMGAGISMSFPVIPFPTVREKNHDSIIQCGSTLAENLITNNTISCVASHITRPAYGILINQLQSTESLQIEHNTITTIHGGGAALSKTIPSGGTQNSITIIPSILPYEPTSGIYLLESNCTTVKSNTIQTVGPIKNNARGITTTASSDIVIYDNSITTIQGPGIFVGGAPVPIESDPVLELVSASVRNLIFNNQTFDNSGNGIELGVSNWSNFFEAFAIVVGTEQIPVTIVIGNHNQPAPQLLRIICNSNGTTTITVRLTDTNHPTSTFIIQFFKNSTNSIPHGETPITDFDGSEFTMTTNSNGIAQKTFVFTPLVPIEQGDNITAHVTLIEDGSLGTAGTELSDDIGDTSEFGVESKISSILGPLSPQPKPFTFNQLLCR